MADSQARRFCFTINNPDKTDDEYCKYIENLEHFKYCAFQRERGHETGTEHIQGFIVFTIAKRFSTIKNYFPKAHIEQAQGSNVQCRDYCTKSDTRISGPFELGQFSEARERTDIKNIMDLVKSGADNKTIRDLFPKQYLQFRDKINAVRQDMLDEDYGKRMRDVSVTYIYGETGTGKTYNVLTHYGFDKVYRVTDYIKDPWDGYEKVVLFEEFRSQIPIWTMLNYLDIYPLKLSSRFRNKRACYDKVFITTNVSPLCQYSGVKLEHPETFKAFNRRLHNILHFADGKVYVERCKDYEELKELLPKNIIEKLDFSPIQRWKEEQLEYDLLYSEELPFDE